MNIENIMDITEEEYLSVLPEYQKEIVSQLIISYGIEGAVDKLIEANGPQNNAQFGGSEEGIFLSKFKDTIKIEINKFICGHSTLSKTENLAFDASVNTLQASIVTAVSNSIGPILSISPVAVAPVVVIMFIATKKIGLNSYCELVGFPKK